MSMRPEWRRRAAKSGVLPHLISLIAPGILVINPFPDQPDKYDRLLMGYNMLVQVLMAINWCSLAQASCCCALST